MPTKPLNCKDILELFPHSHGWDTDTICCCGCVYFADNITLKPEDFCEIIGSLDTGWTYKICCGMLIHMDVNKYHEWSEQQKAKK